MDKESYELKQSNNEQVVTDIINTLSIIDNSISVDTETWILA